MSGLVRLQGPDKDTRHTNPCDKGPHAISSEGLGISASRACVVAVAPGDCSAPITRKPWLRRLAGAAHGDTTMECQTHPKAKSQSGQLSRPGCDSSSTTLLRLA
jgi:hypothetical protein